MTKIKILIIEDDPDILDLLVYNLQRHNFFIFSENNGEQGLKTAKKVKPDLIILDLMLPGIDGYEVCKQIRQTEDIQSIPIIMLTAKVQESDIVIGLELGCDDYMAKPFSPRELIARIKAILRRKQFNSNIQKDAISIGSLRIDRSNYEVIFDSKVISTTLSEFKILYALMKSPKKVFSRENLLNYINDNSITIIDRNVDVHIRSLRKKLGSKCNYIKTVRGVGYKFQL